MRREEFLGAMIVVLTLFFASARANEGGGGGEGGGKSEGEAAKPEAKNLPEWVEIQTRMQATRAKVQAKQKSVEDLIREKQTEKDPRRSLELVESLKREHREMEKLAEEYEQQRNLLRYRFPEKGMKEEARYRRIEVKPLEEMESQIGLEGRLKKTMGTVRRQYGTPEPPAPPRAAEKANPAEPPGAAVTEPKVLSK